MMDIQNIKFELLRPGPAHNQLLSPLTSYIALCGRAEPVTIHFPFEHQKFLSHLERLRYITPSGSIPEQQREAEVQEIGEIIGNVFGLVTTLVSEIEHARTGDNCLVHLRISTSAFELALVPFEFAIAPNGFPGFGTPLFLQSIVPICITREVRRGRSLPVNWNQAPKILFAFANPGDLPVVPAQEHLEALRRAIEPWVKWHATPKERVENEVKPLITVVPNATIKKIRQKCAESEFTHIHILAHGGSFENAGDRHYGLILCSENDDTKRDIVDGERLFLAVTGVTSSGRMGHCPTLVSLSTCDSGNVSSVLTSGGSIAHELHAGGIPWVIASQLPLHMRASSLATEILYKGLFRGDDPRCVLYDMRQRLRTDSAGTHDWASIVAYASIPWGFEQQVDAFRNRQVRTELDVMFDKADKIVDASTKAKTTNDKIDRSALFTELQYLYQTISQKLARWIDDIPSSASSQERAERLGMSGASEKRFGILFGREGVKEQEKKAYLSSCDFYRQAMEADPANHWVITQYLSLRAILAGKKEQRSIPGEDCDWWITARQTALRDIRSASDKNKIWAHGTLAELEMLGTIYSQEKTGKDEVKSRVVEYCKAICDLAGSNSFYASSTRRQFQRYLDYWKRDEWNDLAAAAIKALGETG